MLQFFRSAEWFQTPLPLSSSSEPPAPFLCSSSVAQFFQRQVKLSKFNSSSASFKVLNVGVNLSLVQASAQTSHSRQRRFLVH